MLAFEGDKSDKSEIDLIVRFVMAMFDHDGDKELKYNELLPLITLGRMLGWVSNSLLHA